MMREAIADTRVNVAAVETNLYRGSFAALLRVVLAIPVYMVLTPYVLKYLHTEQFAMTIVCTIALYPDPPPAISDWYNTSVA